MANSIGPSARVTSTGRWRRMSFGGVVLLAVLLTLTAAATTLAYAHQKKITPAYAAASFVNFQDEVQGVAGQLPSLQGAPSARTVRHLLALYEPAERAVMHPCLAP